MITLQNFEAMFQDVLTPFQLEGLRLLLQKTTAQRHNLTLDRSTAKAVEGVSCLDCHVNGHTTGQFHLTPDVRPQSERFRIDTVTLRGVFVQTRFGSKRDIRSLEQFAETEENSAYSTATSLWPTRRGRVNSAARGHVDGASNIIDFSAAPKLNNRASRSLEGDEVRDTRRVCLYEELRELSRAAFYTTTWRTTCKSSASTATSARFDGNPGAPKGDHDLPSARHQGGTALPARRRLLTLEDTVEFFNLVMQLRMTQQDKADLVAFLRVL